MSEQHERRVEKLKKVEGLTALGSSGQVRSIMEFFSVCVGDLERTLDTSSRNLEACIKKGAGAIKDFNESSDKLGRRMLWLNIVLTVATVVGAVATFWNIFIK